MTALLRVLASPRRYFIYTSFILIREKISWNSCLGASDDADSSRPHAARVPNEKWWKATGGKRKQHGWWMLTTGGPVNNGCRSCGSRSDTLEIPGETHGGGSVRSTETGLGARADRCWRIKTSRRLLLSVFVKKQWEVCVGRGSGSVGRAGWPCVSEFKEINRTYGSWSLRQRRKNPHKTLFTYNFITHPQEQPLSLSFSLSSSFVNKQHSRCTSVHVNLLTKWVFSCFVHKVNVARSWTLLLLLLVRRQGWFSVEIWGRDGGMEGGLGRGRSQMEGFHSSSVLNHLFNSIPHSASGGNRRELNQSDHKRWDSNWRRVTSLQSEVRVSASQATLTPKAFLSLGHSLFCKTHDFEPQRVKFPSRWRCRSLQGLAAASLHWRNMNKNKILMTVKLKNKNNLGIFIANDNVL